MLMTFGDKFGLGREQSEMRLGTEVQLRIRIRGFRKMRATIKLTVGCKVRTKQPQPRTPKRNGRSRGSVASYWYHRHASIVSSFPTPPTPTFTLSYPAPNLLLMCNNQTESIARASRARACEFFSHRHEASKTRTRSADVDLPPRNGPDFRPQVSRGHIHGTGPIFDVFECVRYSKCLV